MLNTFYVLIAWNPRNLQIIILFCVRICRLTRQHGYEKTKKTKFVAIRIGIAPTNMYIPNNEIYELGAETCRYR